MLPRSELVGVPSIRSARLSANVLERRNPRHPADSRRAGDQMAQGQLLELYRNYLRLVARAMIGWALRVRLDASDLVQETFLKAHREFGQFLGATEPELVSWLRQIMIRTLANQARHHRRKGRDYQRDEPLDALLERSNSELQRALAVPLSSLSSHNSRREQAVLLADALEKLPADYREIFLMRNLEHIPFEEIAVRMGRSPGAARMLWTRTIKRLSQMLKQESS